MTRPLFRSTLGRTGITGLVGAGLVLGWAAPAVAQDVCVSSADSAEVICTYLVSGTEHVFVVPDGVTSLTVTAVGGAGGRAVDGPDAGRPAAVSGTLAVSPGSALVLAVGGPADSGTGGASDVRTISSTLPGSLESRLLVAAGSGDGAAQPAGGAGDPTAWSHAEPAEAVELATEPVDLPAEVPTVIPVDAAADAGSHADALPVLPLDERTVVPSGAGTPETPSGATSLVPASIVITYAVPSDGAAEQEPVGEPVPVPELAPTVPVELVEPVPEPVAAPEPMVAPEPIVAPETVIAVEPVDAAPVVEPVLAAPVPEAAPVIEAAPVLEATPVPAAVPVLEAVPVVEAAPAVAPQPEDDVLEVRESVRLGTVAATEAAPDEELRLLDTEGVGTLAAALLGSITLALAVVIVVTARRRPGD